MSRKLGNFLYIFSSAPSFNLQFFFLFSLLYIVFCFVCLLLLLSAFVRNFYLSFNVFSFIFFSSPLPIHFFFIKVIMYVLFCTYSFTFCPFLHSHLHHTLNFLLNFGFHFFLIFHLHLSSFIFVRLGMFSLS